MHACLYIQYIQKGHLNFAHQLYIHVLVGDEKEERKKQARSNKQQGKVTHVTCTYTKDTVLHNHKSIYILYFKAIVSNMLLSINYGLVLCCCSSFPSDHSTRHVCTAHNQQQEHGSSQHNPREQQYILPPTHLSS